MMPSWDQVEVVGLAGLLVLLRLPEKRNKWLFKNALRTHDVVLPFPLVSSVSMCSMFPTGTIWVSETEFDIVSFTKIRDELLFAYFHFLLLRNQRLIRFAVLGLLG